MSSENPYQSPQSEPAVDPPSVTSGDSRGPTWRLVVLFLLSLPAMIGLVTLVLANLPDVNTLSQAIAGLAITAVILFAYLGAVSVIVAHWRAPAQRFVLPGMSARAIWVQVGIWTLALIAAPSAFFFTCTPAALLGAAVGSVEGSIILGLLAGVVGLYLVGRLGYGLWLDAAGRPRSPTPQEPTAGSLPPPPADLQS